MTGPIPAPVALDWGVRRGWRAYVMGLADGRFETAGGVTLEPQSARFPLLDASDWAASTDGPGGTGSTDGTGGSGVLRFSGALTAYGHFGMVLGYVIDPWLEVTDQGAVLTAVRWPGREDRIALAAVTGNPFTSEAACTLTLEGTEVFGSVYQAGAEMDPLRVLTTADLPSAVHAE